ncbi:DUF3397 family protein [Furfurilactobacillus sp. WILCCON 0119]
MINEIIIQVACLILLAIIMFLLRRLTHKHWPAWIHPLDALLPVLLVLNVFLMGTLSVRPLFLWAVAGWFLIGIITAWRIFQGRKPVSYQKWAVVYWRSSDLYWLAMYIITVIVVLMTRR